ncbi:MAG: bacillithiol biosynthesis cysteine-adding enzyme BshC [Flavobacteriales bacterium]
MSSRTIHIPYGETARFSELVTDLLSGAGSLQDHYAFSPDLEGLRAAALAREFSVADRAVLCDALERQYKGIELGEATARNLSLLRKDGTLTVTTGHQLCLFTGPLYVPYKILNAIRLARSATEQFGKPVVPVFWMATEDHDVEEIDHAQIGATTVRWTGAGSGPVGRMRLKEITTAVEEAIEVLGPGKDAPIVADLLRQAYTPQRTLAEATRHFVHALFGRFGLLILDGDDAELKHLFAPVVQEELLNQVAVRAVGYANEKLSEKYGVQAHAREINVFHLRPGGRSRIVLEEDHLQVLNGGPRWTVEEAIAAVEIRPQDFSPNVILRPIYQERILPNIGYIGGGGEIAYWMQLRWLFQALQVPMPVVLLRTSAATTTKKHMDQWEALGLSASELFQPLDEVKAKVARERSSFSVSLIEEREALERLYDGIRERVERVDVTLKGSVEARRTHALQGLERIEKGLLRAAKRELDTALRQMDAANASLFPQGGLQERKANILPLLAAKGLGELDRLLEELDPLHPRFTLFVED